MSQPTYNQKEVLDLSTVRTRNAMIFFLSFGAYLLVSTFGVKDLDIFLPDATIQLPLIQVELPMLSFFIVVPILFLALHLNILFNLAKHKDKLLSYFATLNDKEKEDRTQHLTPSIFDFSVAIQPAQPFYKVLRLFIFCLLILLPLITFGAIIIRWLDKQDFWLTLFHSVFFLLDLFIIHKHGKNLMPDNFFRRTQQLVTGLCVCLLFTLWFFFERYIIQILPFTHNKHAIIQHCDNLLMPTIDIGNPNLYELSDSQIKVHKILQQKFHATDDGKQNIQQSHADDFVLIPELDLSFRSFKCANFNKIILPRALLTGSQLQGAKLREAQLQGADLSLAQLQGANLNHTQMQGTILTSAQMQGADLSNAQMQRANLEDAQLQGAFLQSTQLQGANLNHAQMQGTILTSAQMQGAFLQSTQLQRANLEDAQMQGAFLQSIQMQGANLERAQMQGADLQNAQMQGTSLERAQMQGAFLQNAQMQGAFLHNAQMQGAFLHNAQMQGANLHKAQMQGAVLQNTQMQGATTTEKRVWDRLNLIRWINQPTAINPEEIDLSPLSEQEVQEITASLKEINRNHGGWWLFSVRIQGMTKRLTRATKRSSFKEIFSGSESGAFSKEEAEPWLEQIRQAEKLRAKYSQL